MAVDRVMVLSSHFHPFYVSSAMKSVVNQKMGVCVFFFNLVGFVVVCCFDFFLVGFFGYPLIVLVFATSLKLDWI